MLGAIINQLVEEYGARKVAACLLDNLSDEDFHWVAWKGMFHECCERKMMAMTVYSEHGVRSAPTSDRGKARPVG
jgi:hypothetical protein